MIIFLLILASILAFFVLAITLAKDYHHNDRIAAVRVTTARTFGILAALALVLAAAIHVSEIYA